MPLGLQDIPTHRISTVKFTRYKGNKRALFGTLFSAGGLALGAGAQTLVNESSVTGGSAAAWIGVWVGMTVIGYLWGRNKDKKNVTVVIKPPEVPKGP